jgi:predicted ester cyclase
MIAWGMTARTECCRYSRPHAGGKVEVLDMAQEGERVAARMQFSGIVDGRSVFRFTVAIYRFVDTRIAEDWGIGFGGKCPKP